MTDDAVDRCHFVGQCEALAFYLIKNIYKYFQDLNMKEEVLKKIYWSKYLKTISLFIYNLDVFPKWIVDNKIPMNFQAPKIKINITGV